MLKQIESIEMKVFAEKLGYEQRKFMNFKKIVVSMETSERSTWHYIWKCSFWWLLSMCQILCLYQKVHNLPEISSYAAGLLRENGQPNVEVTRVKTSNIL